jgi:hypothetical protein
MRGKIVFAGLILALSGACTGAQTAGSVPSTTAGDIYCSGVVTSEAVPKDTFIITGEDSDQRITFELGAYVYINKGAAQGVKVGDEFSVIRRVVDLTDEDWTKWQTSILHRIGNVWEDEGRLRVTVTEQNTSIAQISHSCGYMQRGDIVLPFTERPFPPRKSGDNFDRFAPPSGKAVAMLITGRDFQVQYGVNDVVYVNLGSSQGVRVGDYLRIFRYNGTEHETAYQTGRFAFDSDGYLGVFGFGSVPARYNWGNVPRQVIGEGLVVRTGPNSSTVLITFSLSEMFAGDYVEIE